MAAGNNPTLLDPKAVLWGESTLQSGDPPGSFTEGVDKYTGASGEAGSRVIEANVTNITTTGAKLRIAISDEAKRLR